MAVVADINDLVEVEHTLAEVAEALFAAGTVQGTLQKIVDLAELAVDGCEAAGIMLIDGGVASTLAASSQLVQHVDQLQVDSDEGPCLDASRRSGTFYAVDLLDDERWPAFAAAAVDAGIRSVLAFSLSADQPSALNLYAALPAAFGSTDRAKGQLFATLARLALDTAEERASEERNLLEALRTRDVIGQAQGILMERDRITADQAFAVLRRASQHMNVKLREVAQSLVETGEAPNTGT
jgi:GAF domain-containing protein